MIDWDAYPNFSEDEFRCKCGCGRADMDMEFMDTLQTLRSILGKPLPITSGFRCGVYNAQVSSTGSQGPHTTGKAADISMRGKDAHRMLRVAVGMFTGVGISQKGGARFIHLDTLPEGLTRPWVWSY